MMSIAAAQAIGKLVGTGLSKITKTTKKTKPKPARKKSKKVPQININPNNIRSSVISAPVVQGMSRIINNGARPHREKFNCLAMQVVQLSAGGLGLRNFTFAGYAGLVAAWDLHPINNFQGYQGAAFGVTMTSLANAYSRWRLVKLRISYEGIMPTSTGGSIAVGYVSDAGISGSVNYQTVASVSDNCSCPLWSARTSFDAKTLDTSWKYCQIGTSSQPEERMDCPGSIIVSGIYTASGGGTIYGTIRLEGEIEFVQLYDGPDFQARTPLIQPSTSSSFSSSCSSVPSTMETVPLLVTSQSSESSLVSKVGPTHPCGYIAKSVPSCDASTICKHCATEEANLAFYSQTGDKDYHIVESSRRAI
jgi:hypothetical protein